MIESAEEDRGVRLVSFDRMWGKDDYPSRMVRL